MNIPILYRKRIMPDECILLKDDEILFCEPDLIITKWNALKPKKDLHHGYSYYHLKKGFKVSKFYRKDNSLLYWYCDIIEPMYNEFTNELIVTDLLVDVIIYPDGFVKVIDLDELVATIDNGSINPQQLKQGLLSLSALLEIIYSGNLQQLMPPLD